MTHNHEIQHYVKLDNILLLVCMEGEKIVLGRWGRVGKLPGSPLYEALHTANPASCNIVISVSSNMLAS